MAKRRSSLYRADERAAAWVKVKNPHYWRRDAELESMRVSPERASSGRSVLSAFGTR